MHLRCTCITLCGSFISLIFKIILIGLRVEKSDTIFLWRKTIWKKTNKNEIIRSLLQFGFSRFFPSPLWELISRSKNDCIDVSLVIGRVITSKPSIDVKHSFLAWQVCFSLKDLTLDDFLCGIQLYLMLPASNFIFSLAPRQMLWNWMNSS